MAAIQMVGCEDGMSQARKDASGVMAARAAGPSIACAELPRSLLARFGGLQPSIIQSGLSSLSSNIPLLPAGVTFCEMKRAASCHARFVESYSSQSRVLPDASVEAAENLAWFESGIFLHVPAGAAVPCLRHVLVSDANLIDRSLVVLEEGSQAVLVQDLASAHPHAASRNGCLEIHLKPRARLTFIEVQRFDQRVRQAVRKTAVVSEGASLTHITVSLGAGASRDATSFFMVGDQGSVVHRRITLAGGRQDHAIKTDVVHQARLGRSDLAIKTVACGNARVASRSTVQICPLAQKTIASLADHSLMLDPDAQAESVPGMEIEADDVQAGHAASMSHLNEEHLFYLQSRGLSHGRAMQEIALGFLESISADAQQVLDVNALVEQWWGRLHEESLQTGINRGDFPILQREIHGKPLVYLDNAATTQKPVQVVEAVSSYYLNDNANIHRGLHTLSERATALYEQARQTVAGFIHASPSEVIFVRNATEGINLLAQCLGKQLVRRGDRILITELEHHSNIVPWQLLARESGAVLDIAPIRSDGTLDMKALGDLMARGPRIVSVCHVSNVLGTVNPVQEIARLAHGAGAVLIVDAAQSVPHMPIDAKELDCDALVFSGHKMLGPTGIGCVFMTRRLMEQLSPFMGGGGMIKEVFFDKPTTFKDGPERFEAGTPHIAGAIGLAAAVEYLASVGMDRIKAHTDKLVAYACRELSKVPHVRLLGPQELSMRAGVIAFNLGDIHAHDVSTVLDEEGVAVRAGHHCAMPLMDRLGVASTCRASFYLYNSMADIDQLVSALRKAVAVFRL